MPAPAKTVHRFAAALLLSLALVAAACAPATRVTPRPVDTATPAAMVATTRPSAAPRPSSTRTAAPARAPSATPRPSATPSPTIPTNTVVEVGNLEPGFSLITYGAVPAPSSLTFGPDGRLYVASAQGAVYTLTDTDGDGRAAPARVFATDLPVPLGLLWIQDRLYVSYNGAVDVVWDRDGDGRADRRANVISGLPSYGLHQNDGLVLGPDGYIYLGQGTTCDHCAERDARNGTILRFKPNGTDFSIYATGLRNPYDLAYNAVGDLFATDNGRDDLGLDLPREELNVIHAGADYGWPDCWTGLVNAACAQTEPAVATFTAHTSANGLAFYHGTQFPTAYFDNAFVAITGSLYLLPDHPEHGVVRVQLTPDGAGGYRAVNSWFLDLPLGRATDVTVGPDGALYVTDYVNGVVYKIVYGAP